MKEQEKLRAEARELLARADALWVGREREGYIGKEKLSPTAEKLMNDAHELLARADRLET